MRVIVVFLAAASLGCLMAGATGPAIACMLAAFAAIVTA